MMLRKAGLSMGSLQGIGCGTKTQKVRAICDFLKTFLIMKVTYKKGIGR